MPTQNACYGRVSLFHFYQNCVDCFVFLRTLTSFRSILQIGESSSGAHQAVSTAVLPLLSQLILQNDFVAVFSWYKTYLTSFTWALLYDAYAWSSLWPSFTLSTLFSIYTIPSWPLVAHLCNLNRCKERIHLSWILSQFVPALLIVLWPPLTNFLASPFWLQSLFYRLSFTSRSKTMTQ